MLECDPLKQFLQKEEFQQCIEHHSLEELETLQIWLKEAIKERKKGHKRKSVSEKIPVKKGREVVETRSIGTATYRLEMVKCGKKKCKCNKGKLHGPYWYAYRWDGKKLSSTYVGKTLKDAGATIENSDDNLELATDSPQ